MMIILNDDDNNNDTLCHRNILSFCCLSIYDGLIRAIWYNCTNCAEQTFLLEGRFSHWTLYENIPSSFFLFQVSVIWAQSFKRSCRKDRLFFIYFFFILHQSELKHFSVQTIFSIIHLLWNGNFLLVLWNYRFQWALLFIIIIWIYPVYCCNNSGMST